MFPTETFISRCNQESKTIKIITIMIYCCYFTVMAFGTLILLQEPGIKQKPKCLLYFFMKLCFKRLVKRMAHSYMILNVTSLGVVNDTLSYGENN